jgi:hypothetical protein
VVPLCSIEVLLVRRRYSSYSFLTSALYFSTLILKLYISYVTGNLKTFNFTHRDFLKTFWRLVSLGLPISGQRINVSCVLLGCESMWSCWRQPTRSWDLKPWSLNKPHIQHYLYDVVPKYQCNVTLLKRYKTANSRNSSLKFN